MKLNIGAPHTVHQYSTYLQIKGIYTDRRTRFLYCWLGLLIKRLYLSHHAFSAVQCGMRRACQFVLNTLTDLFTRIPFFSLCQTQTSDPCYQYAER